MAKPPTSHGSPWTRQDFATIRKLVREGTPARKIARSLGRTLASLYMRASNEGISLAAPKRRVSKPTSRGAAKRGLSTTKGKHGKPASTDRRVP